MVWLEPGCHEKVWAEVYEVPSTENGTTSRISLDSYLNWILCEGSILCNRPVHCDRRWIVRARVRTGAGAGPAGKTVTHLGIVGRCCTNRDSRSAVSPPTARTNRAARSVRHRQKILCPECRRVRGVGGRRNRVRDSSATAPICPDVPNACATALRGSCGNGVTRTGRPGKGLCRTVTSAVNSERETCESCLDSHLDHR